MNTTRVRRILKLLTALHSGKALSVDDLAQELDVTRRTVFRDLSVLERSGVPFQFDRRQKRYRIRQDFFIPPISFSLAECLAMMFMSQKVMTEELSPDFSAATLATMKLESALPHDLREHCQNVLGKLDFNMPAVSAAHGARHHIPALQRALAEQRKVQIVYEPPDKPGFEDCLHPYRIAFINRGWYVIGYSEKDEAVRTFKIERLARCQILDGLFEMDEKFDLAEYFGNAWQMIRGRQRYRIKLKFTPKVATNVEEVMWHKTQSTWRTDDSSLMFEADVDGIEEVSWWVLGYGEQVEVLEPPELRDLVHRRVENVCRIYADGR